MLNMHRAQQITDIIHGSVTYSGIEREVIGTPIFNRLHRVLQGSLVYLTFSSNKIKRFEHSIGTMHIAGQILFYSLCNASERVIQAFLSETKQEISSWRKKVPNNDISYIISSDQGAWPHNKILDAPVPGNSLYKTYLPENVNAKDKFAYYVAFQAIRLSALLHDIGHLPYSHILEHAIKNLHSRISSLADKQAPHISFLETLEPYTKGAELHEIIGMKLIDRIKMCITDELPRRSDPERFFLAVVFDFAKKILNSKPQENNIFADLHRIVAGVVDADRLDYCSRDAFCSGTRKDIFPFERFLPNFQLAQVESEESEAPIIEQSQGSASLRKKFFFCAASKSASEIADLLNRRWRVYMDINYHHRVHKHEIILEEVIAELGEMELSDKLEISESLSYELPLKLNSIWQLIGELETNVQLEYKIIQLDDSWLDTLLKKKFFEVYKDNCMLTAENGIKTLWNKFDELISAKKRYFSLFKRSSDFQAFDEKLYKNIVSAITSGKLSGEGKLYNSIVAAIVSGKLIGDEKLYKNIVEAIVSGILIDDEEHKKRITSAIASGELIGDEKLYKSIVSAIVSGILINDEEMQKYIVSAIASRNLISDYTSYFSENSRFFFDQILPLCKNLTGIDMAVEIERLLKQRLMTAGNEISVQDCLVRLCDFGLGTNTSLSPVYLISPTQKPIKLERLLPRIDETFRRERGLSPLFHLYYLPKFDSNHSEYKEVDMEKLIDLVVEVTIDVIQAAVKKYAERKSNEAVAN